MLYSISSFAFFYRYLFSKKANSVVRRVSIICFLGLTVSIGSLLIVFNVMGGLGRAIEERFLATEPHVIISFENINSPEFIKEQKNKIQTVLKKEQLDKGVSDFYFFETVDLVIRTSDGTFSGAVARGYDSLYLEKFLKSVNSELKLSSKTDILDNVPLKNQKKEDSTNDQPIEDSSIQVETVHLGGKELFFVKQKEKREEKKNIVMGLGLASELNLYEKEPIDLIPAENLLLPPGEPIQFEPAQVDLIVSTQNAIWNSSYIFYDREDFPFLQESSSYGSGFEMRLKEPRDFLMYKTTLEKEGFFVEVWPERNSSIFFALKVEKIIMSLFLSLAGIITLLAVCSLLVLLMVQKKKEMGALMAIGLPLQKIQSLFIGIGLILCSLGMLGAWLFSLSVCLFLKYSNIPYLAQFHSSAQFPVEFNTVFMIFLFIGIFILAFFGCLLSVRSQFRYSPAELLKTVNS